MALDQQNVRAPETCPFYIYALWHALSSDDEQTFSTEETASAIARRTSFRRG